MESFLRKNKILIAILFLALILRVGFLFIFNPPLTWNYDETFYITSQNILKGEGYSLKPPEPFISREPGYSIFFLAPLYLITGSNVLAGQGLNILLSLIVILLIVKIGERYFSKQAGLIGGFLFSVYPPLIAYSGELLPAIPFTFLLILGVWLLIKSASRESKKLVFLVGIIIGMASLTKSTATFLPVFFVPFLYFSFGKNLKETLKYFLLIVLGLLIVVTPYTLRNYLVFGRFLYNRDDGGLNLWAGSYTPWDGKFWGNDAFPLPELTKGLGKFEADKKLKELALKNIKENPFGVLKVWFKKPSRMLFTPEFDSVISGNNKLARYSSTFYFLNPNFIKELLLLINVLIISLALLGAFTVEHFNKRIGVLLLLVLLYFFLILLPFSPDTRYKLPLMPYLMLFSGMGTLVLWKLLKKQLSGA
jgi:4-amino-4-deoxy-L-arabinose transferase-like glycosyltransferase